MLTCAKEAWVSSLDGEDDEICLYFSQTEFLEAFRLENIWRLEALTLIGEGSKSYSCSNNYSKKQDHPLYIRHGVISPSCPGTLRRMFEERGELQIPTRHSGSKSNMTVRSNALLKTRHGNSFHHISM